MKVNLIKEKDLEKIFIDFMDNNKSEVINIYYRNIRAYELYRNNYINFKDNHFKKSYISLVNEDLSQYAIFSNPQKNNDRISYLLIVYLKCDKYFLEEAIRVLESLYSKNTMITKIKLICFENEVEEIETVKDLGFVNELSYNIGNNRRTQNAYFINND